MNNMNIDENTMKNIKNMVDNGNLSDAISQISPEMMQNFSKIKIILKIKIIHKTLHLILINKIVTNLTITLQTQIIILILVILIWIQS